MLLVAIAGAQSEVVVVVGDDALNAIVVWRVLRSSSKTEDCC
jgi:hypothetical protein